METNGTGKFCVAVFHQLHCVVSFLLVPLQSPLNPNHLPSRLTQNVLRHAYYHALDGKKGLDGHVTHCLAYLRQSLKCAADVSLEPYRALNNGVDGFFSSRQCRNYEAVYHWAERFRYTEEKSIDNHQTHDGSVAADDHEHEHHHH